MKKATIALIGDYNPAVTAHAAIPLALRASGPEPVEHVWIPTESLDGDVAEKLEPYDGIWCVPASPYKNTQGALNAIRFARELERPFLGTCGGFQHAVLEYAHNALGLVNAAHAELDPAASEPLITPLACAMMERAGEIFFGLETRIRTIYNADRTVETYHCSYGFNAEYAPVFASSAMVISAIDRDDRPQAIELPNHPFFLATAFQPERSGLRNERHPLVAAFVQAVQNRGA